MEERAGMASTKKDCIVEGVRVGQAKYGLGVYATRAFAAEESIGQVQGYIIRDPYYSSDYCISLSDDYSLEPAAPYRFVNHSCTPNCQLVQYDIEDKGETVPAEIWLETIRPISDSEQLTIDYAWQASGAILCGCDSERCRGWIVAGEERDQLPSVKVQDVPPVVTEGIPLADDAVISAV
jgi:hypothetical protein